LNSYYKFQREHGLIEEYTDDATGTAVGKTLTYEENGCIRNTIFLDKFILSDTKKELSQWSIHLIHHELCHVHDNFMKFNMFGMEFILRKGGNLNRILKIHAVNIWSEHIAIKLSVLTTSKEHDWKTKYLIDLIKVRKEEFNKAIDLYKENNDVKSFYGQIQLITSSLLCAACTVYGYLHGMEILLDNTEILKVKTAIKEYIKETYFDEVWELLNEQLTRMSISYPYWDDEIEIGKLGDIVLKMWNKMGAYPVEDSRGELIINLRGKTP